MSQFKSDQFENMSAAATHNFDLSLKKSVLKRFWRIFSSDIAFICQKHL